MPGLNIGAGAPGAPANSGGLITFFSACRDAIESSAVRSSIRNMNFTVSPPLGAALAPMQSTPAAASFASDVAIARSPRAGTPAGRAAVAGNRPRDACHRRAHEGIAARRVSAHRSRRHDARPQSQQLFRGSGAGRLRASNVPAGLGFSPDKMLQARLLSYPDAHRYRLGVNDDALPVNHPHACLVHTYHRDGALRFDDDGGSDSTTSRTAWAARS